MRPDRIVDPGNQPERHIERRHGVPSRRDLTGADRASDRRGSGGGVAVGNGDVIVGPEIRQINFPAGTGHVTVAGDAATVWTTVRVKSGTTVADSDFPTTPPDGTLAVTTGNNRLWVRVSGTWRYAALT